MRAIGWALLGLLLVRAPAWADVAGDSRSWTRRDFSNGPVPRFWHNMSYAGAGKVLMMGGNLSGSAEMGTWFWDGASGTWSSVNADPPASAKGGGIALAYDSDRQRVTFFGGTVWTNSGYYDTNDLWELDGQKWSKVAASGTPPSPRSGSGFVYDPKRKRFLMHAGYPGSNAVYDTWDWDGKTWKKLSPVTEPRGSLLAMMWLPDREGIFAFYAAGPIKVWAWNGQDWILDSEQVVPDWPSSPAIAYAGSGRVVAFGGYIYDGMKQTAYGDTYEWSAGKWTKVTTAQRPSIREASVAVYDPSRDRAVLYGGRAYPGGDTSGQPDFGGDLWEYALTAATLGTACDPAHADRCAGGNCVGGTCCATASCNSCQACNVPGSEGRCAPLEPLPMACQPPPPDAAPMVSPDAAGVPPAVDAGGVAGDAVMLPTPDAGADAGGAPVERRDGGSTGADAVPSQGGARGATPGGLDDESDGGRAISMRKPEGPKLYTGPACALGTGAPGFLLPLIVAAAALLGLRRRRR